MRPPRRCGHCRGTFCTAPTCSLRSYPRQRARAIRAERDRFSKWNRQTGEIFDEVRYAYQDQIIAAAHSDGRLEDLPSNAELYRQLAERLLACAAA